MRALSSLWPARPTDEVAMRSLSCRIEDFKHLVAELAACPQPHSTPAMAGLLLFAEVADRFSDALPERPPGHVLVLEAFSLDAIRLLDQTGDFRIAMDAPRSLGAQRSMAVAAAITDAEGEALAQLRATFRMVAVTRLASALAPASRMSGGEAIELPPFAAAAVRRYLELVSDTNPIHDAAGARAVGLPCPVVPGALIAAVCEALAVAVAPGALRRMNMRFLAPVYIGERLRIAVEDRTPPEATSARRI